MDGGDDGDDDDGDLSGDDADDEEGEEEHPAPADSAVVVPTVEPVSPPKGTEPVILPNSRIVFNSFFKNSFKSPVRVFNLTIMSTSIARALGIPKRHNSLFRKVITTRASLVVKA
ncbi:hypothetical protein Tco_1090380 [Tanacetum coccineum]|uniref:Uncharacterized protein n=1 Tax=Tanacetum coccineum TaxID=301880 RepID=A0ABQ5I418_9ASTR